MDAFEYLHGREIVYRDLKVLALPVTRIHAQNSHYMTLLCRPALKMEWRLKIFGQMSTSEVSCACSLRTCS